MLFYQTLTAIDGTMPSGGHNHVKIAVASIPSWLAMKGHALMQRHKRYDAYDVHYCIRNYEAGPEARAKSCRPLLGIPDALDGYRGKVR